MFLKRSGLERAVRQWRRTAQEIRVRYDHERPGDRRLEEVSVGTQEE